MKEGPKFDLQKSLKTIIKIPSTFDIKNRLASFGEHPSRFDLQTYINLQCNNYAIYFFLIRCFISTFVINIKCTVWCFTKSRFFLSQQFSDHLAVQELPQLLHLPRLISGAERSKSRCRQSVCDWAPENQVFQILPFPPAESAVRG